MLFLQEMEQIFASYIFFSCLVKWELDTRVSEQFSPKKT